MDMGTKKAFLMILDGWGHGKIPEVSAISQAKTPFVDQLYKDYPNAELTTFGHEVGLPEGQMGNSEVGHLNIGAGRVVFQELARINESIKDGSFQENPVLLKAIAQAQLHGKQLHIMGLLSDGGVHAHIEHFKAISTLLNEKMIPCSIHAFLDGRDTSPNGGIEYVKTLQEHIKDTTVRLATVIGRYYSMDRDNRWERIKKAYDLLVNGIAELSTDIHSTLSQKYKEGITDEFMEPIKLIKNKSAQIQEGDVVIFMNFRTDRPRELTRALTQEAFPNQGMNPLKLHYVTLTDYDPSYKDVHVMYAKQKITHSLGEHIASHKLKQVRIAETEKYPHVTFFFNGGEEKTFEGENRILAPSPKVATYDLQPEMSAFELRDKIITAMNEASPDFICLNFANTDMVGHTGIFEAAVKSAETVDQCLSQIVPVALENDYYIIIIADHGNADIMINPDGSPHTAHTTNPVPIFVLSPDKNIESVKPGKLADIAPTILHLMGLEIPEQMTGEVLVKS